MMLQRENVSRGCLVAMTLILACKGGGGATGGGGENGSAGGDGGQSAAAGTSAQGGGTGGDPGGDGGGGQPGGGDGGTGAGAGGSPQAGTGGAGGGAGTSAAGGQGGDSLDPCTTNTYCNDFETTAVGAKPTGTFYSVTAGNTLAVTEDKAHSGKRSLYIDVTVDGPSNFSFLLRNRLKNPKFVAYARMWVWLDSLSSGGGGGGYWKLLSMSGRATTNGNRGAGVMFAGPDGTATSWLLYQGGGPPIEAVTDCYKSAQPFVVPLKQWACIEMKVDETSALAYGFSVNNTPVPAFSVGAGSNCTGPPWYVIDVDTIGIGWNHAHKQNGTARMWIDDVVVDEKPIGCQ